MKITYEGEDYDLDLQRFTLKQAMAIQSYAGTSIKGLFETVEAQFEESAEDTPELFKALGALYWLMMNQAGNVFPISDTDFPVVDFTAALFQGLLDSAPAADSGAEPGPTQPPASPPASASPKATQARTRNQTRNGHQRQEVKAAS